MLDCILQFKHYVINIWFCLNPIKNGDIFVLAHSQPSWVQAANSRWPCVDSGFSASPALTAFAVLFELCPVWALPSDQCGAWAMLCPVVHFLNLVWHTAWG